MLVAYSEIILITMVVNFHKLLNPFFIYRTEHRCNHSCLGQLPQIICMFAFLAFISQQQPHLLLCVDKEYSMFTNELTSVYIFYIYEGNANFVLLVEDMWLALFSLQADLSSAVNLENMFCQILYFHSMSALIMVTDNITQL